MEITCRRCGKVQEAKRSTRRYCQDNCRAAYNQSVKRGQAIANPLSEGEAYLLEVVLEVAGLAASIWAEISSETGRLSIANIERLGRCAGAAQWERIRQLKERYEQMKRLNGKGVSRNRRKKSSSQSDESDF